MKKILLALVVLAFLATPAVAGNQPEFDAVGCDATNFFNDFIRNYVCANGEARDGKVINLFSDFTDAKKYDPAESFTQTAGQLWPDPCFTGVKNGCAYESALTDAWNEAIYTWVIVLQMKPESDINLNIRDCVLKHNTFEVWGGCEQTGRYRAPWGELIFLANRNPLIKVTAIAGPYATPAFAGGEFIMQARPMPGTLEEADLILLDGVASRYTSKCLWEEALVIKLPFTLDPVAPGTYSLKQGDAIKVEVTIPFGNSVDLFYGQDNVSVKYIGITGTEYTGDCCGVDVECGDCAPVGSSS